MTETENAVPIPDLPRRIVGKHFRKRCVNTVALGQVYFVDCTFSDLTFTQFDARELHFERCSFHNVRLHGGKLDTCSVRFSTLNGLHMQEMAIANFTGLETNWYDLTLEQCLAERWVMAGCSLDNARWQASSISYWTAQNTPVTHLTAQQCDMQDGNWHGCTLAHVTWHECAITRQVMGSCELRACGYAGNVCDILVWSACRLQGLDLSKLNLTNSSFQNSQLQDCRFTQSTLNAAQFNGATLEQCDFSKACADDAQFTDAALSGCQFIETSLKRALLLRTRLTRCNLMQANLSHADLRASDLRSSPLQPAITHKTRLHDAQLLPLDWALKTPEPLMAQIDSWYQRHQPGPQEPGHFPPLPSGASRYV